MKGEWMMWLAVGIGIGSVMVNAGLPMWMPFVMVLWLSGTSAMAHEMYRRHGPTYNGGMR